MGFLNRKNSSDVDAHSLTLKDEKGEKWIDFPEQTVNAVRQTITRLMRTDPFPERLVLTSAVRQEGVTYLSRAIGTVLAKDMNRKFCVLELNWWWPADYPESMNDRPGVAEIISGKATVDEAQMPTGLENLTFIRAGKLANNQRSQVSHSDELNELISMLSESFDHLIIDLPAVTAASDSILLASHGTGVCLVIQQGLTPVQRVKATLDDLNHLNVLGVIMNQVNIATPSFLLNYIAQD
jgi:Mrp family chromosome partitioning ATPase